MGIAFRVAVCQPYRLHNLFYFGLIFILCLTYFIIFQRLPDKILYAFPGVQRSLRILENHLHLLTDFMHLLFVITRNINSVIDNLSARRLVKMQKQPAKG